MMDFTNIWTVTHKELRDALRNRWFLLYTLIFGGLALALSMTAQPDIAFAKLAGYDRTVTSLVNLVLLFVPLMGLMFGATSLASDQETGVLNTLLAQPITRTEILLGKYFGVATALLSSLIMGFGLAGFALALDGGGRVKGYAVMIVFACLLGLAMLSVGFLISTISQKTSTAVGGALFLWLFFVLVGDLGLIGASIVMELPLETTLLIALISPLQEFKMASISTTQASLDALGPAGLYADDTFGGLFLPLLLASLLLWIFVPLGAAQLVFAQRK